VLEQVGRVKSREVRQLNAKFRHKHTVAISGPSEIAGAAE
jgi:hypothetical protein